MSASHPVLFQEPLQSIVSQLHEKIQENKQYDQKIFKKYHIKKYKLMDDQHKEPVEAWIYDHQSKYIPILEDQAMKRAQSLCEAARVLFEKQKYNVDLIEKTFSLFENAINHVLYPSNIDEATFEAQFTKIDSLIHQLINDLAYHWGHAHAHPYELTKKDYAEFYKNLWDTVEIVTSLYKRSNILVINNDPNVQSVHYYRRGSQPFTPDEKERMYRSSHHREDPGLSNLISYGMGYLKKGIPVITQSGFRHASLPPIGLYKKEERKENSNQ